MKNLIRPLIRLLTHGRTSPSAPPEQLDLGLDRITDSGLQLRDAMVVRSAEFWVALGEPRVALRELESLNKVARQNAWPMRTHLRASHNAHLATT